MPRMGVIGGGPSGLTAAMLAARRGWDVVVFERDVAPIPDGVAAAWSSWDRNSIAQFRLPHVLLPLGAEILRSELPGVIDRMLAAGAIEWSGFDFLPTGAVPPEEGDGRLVGIGGRRPLFELAFAAEAEAHDGVDVRRGVRVEGLLAGAGAVPHVIGIRTDAGDETFDVVIDAGGRRSRVPEMIEAVGGRRPREIAEDSRFTYYSRHFRGAGSMPRVMAPNMVLAGPFAILFLPGDNDTWSTTVYGDSATRELRAVRDGDVFERLVGAVAPARRWIEGEAITDVEVMSGVLDRQRDFVVDGEPIATGVLPVGDAWACTNPSSGRGISFALLHVLQVVDVLSATAGDPVAQVMAWDEVTTTHVQPWHRATLERDRELVAGMAAARLGERLPPSEAAVRAQRLSAAAERDPWLFRRMMEVVGGFTLPDDLFAEPEVAARIDRALAGHELPSPPPYMSPETFTSLLEAP